MATERKQALAFIAQTPEVEKIDDNIRISYQLGVVKKGAKKEYKYFSKVFKDVPKVQGLVKYYSNMKKGQRFHVEYTEVPGQKEGITFNNIWAMYPRPQKHTN